VAHFYKELKMPWTIIFETIKEFFKNLPILDKWFTRTTSEKITSDIKKSRKKTDKFRKTGRPS